VLGRKEGFIPDHSKGMKNTDPWSLCVKGIDQEGEEADPTSDAKPCNGDFIRGKARPGTRKRIVGEVVGGTDWPV